MGYSPWGRKEWDTTARLHFLSDSQLGEVLPRGTWAQCHDWSGIPKCTGQPRAMSGDSAELGNLVFLS